MDNAFFVCFLYIFIIFLSSATKGEGVDISLDSEDEVLSYKASLTTVKNIIDLARATNHEKRDGEFILECPLRRKEPNLSLIQNRLTFDQACGIKRNPMSPEIRDTCHSDQPRFCHKEYPISPNNSTNVTWSILLKYDCPVKRTMRLIGWDQFNINIACDQHDTLEICHGRYTSSYPKPKKTGYSSIIVVGG